MTWGSGGFFFFNFSFHISQIQGVGEDQEDQVICKYLDSPRVLWLCSGREAPAVTCQELGDAPVCLWVGRVSMTVLMA